MICNHLIKVCVCVCVAVASTVKQALQDSLVQILQPKRRVDILRDVMEAQSQRRPFVITFCGVNGVGKSTNLAKVGLDSTHDGRHVKALGSQPFLTPRTGMTSHTVFTDRS